MANQVLLQQLPFILIPDAPPPPPPSPSPSAQATTATTPLFPAAAEPEPGEKKYLLSMKTVPVKSYFFYLNNNQPDIVDTMKRCQPNQSMSVNSVRNTINLWPLRIDGEMNWGVIYNWMILLIPLGISILAFMLVFVMQNLLYTNNDLTEDEFENRFSGLSRDTVNYNLYVATTFLFIVFFFTLAVFYEFFIIWRGTKWADLNYFGSENEYRGLYYKPLTHTTIMNIWEILPLILLSLGMGLMVMILCTTGRSIAVENQKTIFYTNLVLATLLGFFLFLYYRQFFKNNKNKKTWNKIFHGIMIIVLFTLICLDLHYSVADKSQIPTTSS